MNYEQFSYQGTSRQGKAVFLLGTALDGPLLEPMHIQSPQRAEDVFGSPDKGTLVKAAQQILRVFPQAEIYLVRISGTYAEHLLYDENDNLVLSLRSRYPGDIYNEVELLIDHIGLRIRQPNGRTRTYSWDAHPDIGALARAMNSDTDAGVSCVYALAHEPLAESSSIWGPNLTEFCLEGGDSQVELSKNDLYYALDDAYGVLSGLPTDIIAPLGAFVNDSYVVDFYGEGEYGSALYSDPDDALTLSHAGRPLTFHGQLIAFCQEQTRACRFSHGVMRFRPINASQRKRFEEYLKATCLGTRYDLTQVEAGVVRDKGNFLSLVISEPVLNGDMVDGAALYAALLSVTPVADSSTNRQLPGISQRHDFTHEELLRLAELGAVAFRLSPRRGMVVSSGVTAALKGSELTTIANVRSLHHILDALATSLEELFGEPAPQALQARRIDERVRQTLNRLASQQIFLDYEYDLAPSGPGSYVLYLEVLLRHTLERIPLSLDLRRRS